MLFTTSGILSSPACLLNASKRSSSEFSSISYSAHAIGHGPSMRPASGATNAKAGPIRNRHGMAVCASGTARPVPTPSVSTRSTAAATKNDARPYTRISYSPRVPQGTDRRGLPHLQQVGRFWNARLQILPSYGRFAPAGPPPHGHRPGRCACTGPWIRRTCRTMDRHPSKYARSIKRSVQ